jgi:hypothetical protein
MGKLGQLLVARGWITVQQLTRALKNQNVVGGRLGTCLLEMEVLGEDLLARSLAEQLGVPAAEIEDLRAIPDEVLSLIPEKLARRCRAIPFRVAGGRLDVAMQDPRNLVGQDEIAFACGRRVKVHVLHELRIQEALQRYYREECPSRYSLLLDRLNRVRYLWSDAGRQGRGKAADDTGESTEVLSRLPADDLLGGPPRFEPPPLPEPALPSRPRRSWRTPTSAAAASPGTAEIPKTPAAAPRVKERAAPPAPAAETLPPLAELDLRATPRRQRALDASGRPVTPGAPPREPAAAPPAPAQAMAPPAPPAPQSPPPDAHAAPAPSAHAAPAAFQPPAVAPAAAGAVDLDTTLVLTPPAATTAAPALHLASPAAPPAPAAAGEPGGAGSIRVAEPGAAAAAAHPVVTLSDAERAELGMGEPVEPATTAPPTPPTLPTLPTPPTPPTLPALHTLAPLPAVTEVTEVTASLPREAPATLAEVEEALVATTDREEVGRILLGYLGRSFRRVALFQAGRDRMSAWMAHGDDIDQEAFARYSVDFKHPSLFLNLREGSGVHIGPVAPMDSHRELALCWGGGLPRDCVALPVRLKDRLVLVLYLDGGSRGLGGVDLEQMHRLTALTAAAFERCILHKKRGYAQS